MHRGYYIKRITSLLVRRHSTRYIPIRIAGWPSREAQLEVSLADAAILQPGAYRQHDRDVGEQDEAEGDEVAAQRHGEHVDGDDVRTVRVEGAGETLAGIAFGQSERRRRQRERHQRQRDAEFQRPAGSTPRQRPQRPTDRYVTVGR